ncbi:RDD family protein, partial [Halobacteriovorax sp. ZH3_bin.1]
TTQLSLAIMFFSYFFFSYYLGNGQTLGKAFFKLKVVRSHAVTEPLSALDCFGRSIGYVFANLLFFLPLVINFLRHDQKGVQDFISQTHVISTEEFAYALAEIQAEAEPLEEVEQISLFS